LREQDEENENLAQVPRAGWCGREEKHSSDRSLVRSSGSFGCQTATCPVTPLPGQNLRTVLRGRRQIQAHSSFLMSLVCSGETTPCEFSSNRP